MATMRTELTPKDVPDPTAVDETTAPAKARDAKSDDRVAVYVKISQRAREILDAAAQPPRTRATVIEALLESYDKQANPRIKRDMLDGQSTSELIEQGELLQLRSWAEHAFENKRYFWAGGMYKSLANHPASPEGLKNICDYRLSLCLIRLSYDVREEALQESVDPESYDLALRTLDRAITYTSQLRDRLSRDLLLPRLVLYYNLACCHSLKAQYMVERELDSGSDEIKRLREAKKDEKEKAAVWRTIGQDWRQKLKSKGVDEQRDRDIDVEAGKAFNDLQQILPVLANGKTLADPDLALSSERIWLVDSTLNDEDLIFLRFDKQRWQPAFEKWRETALQDRKPTSYAVRALLDELPSSFQSPKHVET